MSDERDTPTPDRGPRPDVDRGDHVDNTGRPVPPEQGHEVGGGHDDMGPGPSGS